MSFEQLGRETADRLAAVKIVPVLVLNSVSDGMRLLGILRDAGLPAAEITFRTAEAEEVIRAASKEFPEFYIGAGTILNAKDLHRAFNTGAKFAVAPGLNPNVVREAAANDFPFAPGICTPSEIEQALELGCRFMKFFPAEAAGGVSYLKAVSAPYKHLGIRFMPTGGVTSSNVSDYLGMSEVAAVGGTWLGKATDIAAGNWDGIEDAIRKAVALIKDLSK